MTSVATTQERAISTRRPFGRSTRRFVSRTTLFVFAVVILAGYLLPLVFMVTTAFQAPSQASTPGAPWYPAAPLTAEFEGETYPIYTVPFEDGTTRQLILVDKGRESSVFVDPNDPAATPVVWEGRWRTLEQAWTFKPEVENFTTAWNQLDFPRLLRNTVAIATLSTIGAVVSSVLVAYGFARFRFPGGTPGSSSSSRRSSCRSR